MDNSYGTDVNNVMETNEKYKKVANMLFGKDVGCRMSSTNSCSLFRQLVYNNGWCGGSMSIISTGLYWMLDNLKGRDKRNYSDNKRC